MSDDAVEVVIEIPKGNRNKYEFDHERQVMRLDRRLEDLPKHLLDEIEHFFNIHKDLEPGKSSSTAGFEGPEAARREIAEAQARAG